MAQLSSRGNRLLLPGLPYMEGVMAGFMNPYNQETNEGIILMAVAENKLAWGLLQSFMQKSLSKPLPQWTSGYGPMHGQVILRKILAKFLNKYIVKNDHEINPDELSCATGCSSIISNMFYCLFEPQDTILIPSPYYSAFDSDLRAFADLNRHPVPLTSHTFELSITRLEQEYQNVLTLTGKPPRALLLTNPHNPTGTIMPVNKIKEIISWCESKPDFHLISDEIYALSSYGEVLKNSNEVHHEEFVSLGKLCTNGELGTHKHVIWGMSKDFGMSGLRFGMLWTQNPKLFEAMANIAPFNSIPGPIQAMLCDMLSDDIFLAHYLSETSSNLAKSCQVLMDCLDKFNIPYITPTSGMFLWINMGKLLPCVALKHDLTYNAQNLDHDEYLTTNEAFTLENHLYEDMWQKANVVATPGSSQHMSQAGWFRCCYAAIPIEVLEVGVNNLSHLFEGLLQ